MVVSIFVDVNYGVSSYVLATQKQSIEKSYHYLVEALKTQHPKIIILETYMFNLYKEEYFSDAVASNAIEPLNWSQNKVEMIRQIVPIKQQHEFFLPLLKYHDKWKSTTIFDMMKRYQGEKDPYRGYVFLKDVKKTPRILDSSGTGPVIDSVNAVDQEYMDKIVALARQEGIPLLLLYAPTATEERVEQSQVLVEDYAKENDVLFLNMKKYLDEMQIDLETDFYDTGHLNVYGAQKQTDFLMGYITSKIDFQKQYSDVVVLQLHQETSYYKEQLDQ